MNNQPEESAENREVETTQVTFENTERQWVTWTYCENSQWYLVCECRHCKVWMLYPGVQHQCPYTGEPDETIQQLGIVRTVGTTWADIAEQLRCRETFLETEG